MLKRLILATIACLAVLSAPAAAAAAPIVDTPVVDLGQRLGKISGYGDVLAWSEYNARNATFSLVVRREGRTPRRLDIATRNRPFDVDVGPDPDGKPTLVYSRCRKDPKRPDQRGLYGYFGLPPYPGGKGCDIYKYSFADAGERQLSNISMRNADEFMPSIWRGRVAFVRDYSGPLRLYIKHAEASHSREFRRSRSAEITSLDLRGQRIAYAAIDLVDYCKRSDVLTVSDAAYMTSIRIAEPQGKPSLIAASCNNDSRQTLLTGGIWSGRTLLYSATRGKDYEAGRIVARSLDGTQRTLATYAFPDTIVYYLTVNDDGIYGAARRGSDGQAHVSRLLDVP